MNKVLLVTGELAERLVQKYASESRVGADVKVLPVSVASFMSSSLLVRGLRGTDLSKYSMILVPGSASFDLKEAEDDLKIPVFKGPKYAADIPPVLENLDKIEFSKDKPACEILGEKISASVAERLRMAEEWAEQKLVEPHNFKVGKGKASVSVGPDFPARIVAEIIDAPLRSDEEIIEIAGGYIREGAEIIDIGMVAGKEMVHEIPRVMSALRKNFEVPLSLDTLNKAEIEKAIDEGIDLVVSIDGSTIDSFKGLDVPAVIVPVDPKRSYYPRDPFEKLKYLKGLLEKAGGLGYERVIADPILEPVNLGFVGSLIAFYELRRLDPRVPIFMGIGNVVELYDADSVGITALLLGAASEIGANFILTTEGSDKTLGNISEAIRARNMMTLAKLRGSVPKDLGLDLLILKDKRRFFDPYDKSIERGIEVVQAAPKEEFEYDPRGFFKIFIHESEIVAVLQTGEGPKIVIKGNNAEDICLEIIERGLVSEIKHAAYLGRELQKAEIALRTRKGYLQEKELF